MEQRRLDVTVTGTAATLLATELLGRASDFTSLFSLMGSLALVGQELLNIEINGMLVRLGDGEDLIVKGHLATGVLTLNVIYCEFHYYISIITIEPLLPGTEPFTMRRLFSGNTLITCRF